MSHQHIPAAEAAGHARIEKEAKAAFDAAYAESRRQYQEDGDHAAFSARNKAAAGAYDAAVAPDRRDAVLERIDD